MVARISTFLSGGDSNTNQALSLGGAKSTAVVPAYPFGDVPESQFKSGVFKYRLVYIQTDVALSSLKVYKVETPSANTTISFAWSQAASGQPETAVANESTAPSGLSFSSATDVLIGPDAGALAAGSWRGLWIKYAVDSGTPLILTENFNLIFEPVEVVRTVAVGYFGMDMGGINDRPWPSVPFTGLRLWDSWGYNSINNAYVGIAWGNLHTGTDTYNWELFDSFMAKLVTNNQLGFYTFGFSPAWLTGGDKAPATGTQLAQWDAFVTAIVTRAAGKIKHWGLWNEPNATNFYTGTPAQLATMAARAYPIIKGIDPTAIVTSPEVQGNGGGWLGEYFTAGGAAYCDAIGFHLYGYPDYRAAADNGAIEALNGIKAAVATAGLSSKPLWNTEFSSLGWADTSMVDYVGKAYPLYWAAGVERSYWYQWDNSVVGNGQMWLPPSGPANAVSVAFTSVRTWLLGASLNAAPVVSGSVIYIDFTRSNGKEAKIIWHTGGSSNHTIPAGAYVTKRLLDGASVVIPGADVTVAINNTPIMIEKA